MCVEVKKFEDQRVRSNNALNIALNKYVFPLNKKEEFMGENKSYTDDDDETDSESVLNPNSGINKTYSFDESSENEIELETFSTMLIEKKSTPEENIEPTENTVKKLSIDPFSKKNNEEFKSSVAEVECSVVHFLLQENKTLINNVSKSIEENLKYTLDMKESKDSNELIRKMEYEEIKESLAMNTKICLHEIKKIYEILNQYLSDRFIEKEKMFEYFSKSMNHLMDRMKEKYELKTDTFFETKPKNIDEDQQSVFIPNHKNWNLNKNETVNRDYKKLYEESQKQNSILMEKLKINKEQSIENNNETNQNRIILNNAKIDSVYSENMIFQKYIFQREERRKIKIPTLPRYNYATSNRIRNVREEGIVLSERLGSDSSGLKIIINNTKEVLRTEPLKSQQEGNTAFDSLKLIKSKKNHTLIMKNKKK